MRSRLVLTLAGAAALFAATSASAQDVVLAPEVRTQVREYVITQPAPPPPPMLPGDFQIAVGTTVPPEIELYPIAVPEAEPYRYVVVENRTVVVDPVTRQVIEIIE